MSQDTGILAFPPMILRTAGLVLAMAVMHPLSLLIRATLLEWYGVARPKIAKANVILAGTQDLLLQKLRATSGICRATTPDNCIRGFYTEELSCRSG